jgi:O-antigen/teichoic acid export membrane protein
MSAATLGRQSLVIFSSGWLNAAIGMVATILVARWLGPQAVGALGFGFGLVGLFMAGILPGFSQAHLKRLSEGQDIGQCIATMAVIQMALHLVLALGVAIFSFWRSFFFETAELEMVFLLLLGSQALSNFSDILLKVFLARGWVVEHALVLCAGKVVRLVLTAAVLLWAPSIRWVAATFLAENLAAFVAAAALIRARAEVGLRRPTLQSLAGYWSFARPLLVTTPIGMFQDSIDRVVVKQWAGIEAAGYYQVARGLWEMLASIPAAPTLLLFTRLSELLRVPTRDRLDEARALFSSALDRLLFITIPAALAMWVFRDPLISLFYGRQFLPASSTVMVFVVVTVAGALINPYHTIIYAMEAHARLVPVVLLRVWVYLVALAALVPSSLPFVEGGTALGLGTVGAALARLILMVFPAWVYFRWTRELAGVSFSPRSWMYLGGLALSIGLHEVFRAALAALDAPVPVAALLAFAAAAGGYGLFLLRWVPGSADNFKYVAGLLNPFRLVEFFQNGARAGTQLRKR